MARYHRRRGAAAWLTLVLGGLCVLSPPATEACFGTRLRIGVSPAAAHALASYVAGYYIEEKTGIEPEFVLFSGTAEQALGDALIDLYLASESKRVPTGMEKRPAGEVAGLGTAQFWIHPEVLDDLRFFTVERTLALLARVYASAEYAAATRAAEAPRKAARQAVLRVD